jgi:hypothetical protein
MLGLFPGTKLERMELSVEGLLTLGRTNPPGGGRSGVGRREGRMLIFWFLGGKGADEAGLVGTAKRGRLEGSVDTSGAGRLVIMGGFGGTAAAGAVSTFVSVGFCSVGV